MDYICRIVKGHRKETWTASIRLLSAGAGYYETEITGRGTYFHVIAGTHQYGNFICIPNLGTGSELADFSDAFWNTERLSGQLPKADAVTVATGLCHLRELEVLTGAAG